MEIQHIGDTAHSYITCFVLVNAENTWSVFGAARNPDHLRIPLAALRPLAKAAGFTLNRYTGAMHVRAFLAAQERPAQSLDDALCNWFLTPAELPAADLEPDHLDVPAQDVGLAEGLLCAPLDLVACDSPEDVCLFYQQDGLVLASLTNPPTLQALMAITQRDGLPPCPRHFELLTDYLGVGLLVAHRDSNTHALKDVRHYGNVEYSYITVLLSRALSMRMPRVVGSLLPLFGTLPTCDCLLSNLGQLLERPASSLIAIPEVTAIQMVYQLTQPSAAVTAPIEGSMLVQEVTVVQWNVNSVKAKTTALQSFVAETRPHALFLSETKLGPKDDFRLPGYEVACRMDRTRRGGGAALLVRNDCTFCQLACVGAPGHHFLAAQ
eukprot:4433107-Amphidinium_carterae.2